MLIIDNLETLFYCYVLHAMLGPMSFASCALCYLESGDQRKNKTKLSMCSRQNLSLPRHMCRRSACKMRSMRTRASVLEFYSRGVGSLKAKRLKNSFQSSLFSRNQKNQNQFIINADPEMAKKPNPMNQIRLDNFLDQKSAFVERIGLVFLLIVE